MTLFVGIDPGKITGVAESCDGGLVFVGSMLIHQAMERIVAAALIHDLTVHVEDARKRKWLGAKGREALQGAGSIKRDCTIWEDFLRDQGIRFVLEPPKNTLTKLNADQFRKLTGWRKRTNEHSRDAAMLVFGR
jgi:hypothetical protein